MQWETAEYNLLWWKSKFRYSNLAFLEAHNKDRLLGIVSQSDGVTSSRIKEELKKIRINTENREVINPIQLFQELPESVTVDGVLLSTRDTIKEILAPIYMAKDLRNQGWLHAVELYRKYVKAGLPLSLSVYRTLLITIYMNPHWVKWPFLKEIFDKLADPELRKWMTYEDGRKIYLLKRDFYVLYKINRLVKP